MAGKNKPYLPYDWIGISERAKYEAGFKCERCGTGHNPMIGHCLIVHHIDCDPTNNVPTNLIALCHACYRMVQQSPYLCNPDQQNLFP